MSTNEHRLIQEQLNEYSSLSLAAQRQIDEHLAECAECAAYLEQMRETDQAIRQMTAAQRVYATHNYLGESKSRLSSLSRELAHPGNRWMGSWSGNTMQLGKLAGVALLLLLVIGFSFIFSNSRIDRQQITPQATATTMSLSETGIVTLTFGCNRELCAHYVQLAEQFHQQYPNLSVELVNFESQLRDNHPTYTFEEYIQAIRGKVDAADLTLFGNHLSIHDKVKEVAVDLTPFLKRDPILNRANLYPVAQQFLMSGTNYLLPAYLSPVVILYDPTVFDLAGLPYPTGSWSTEEFFSTAEKLTLHDDQWVSRYGFVLFDDVGLALPNHAFVLGQLDHAFDPTTLAPLRSLNEQELTDAVYRFANLVRTERAMPNFVDPLAIEKQLLTGNRAESRKNAAMWTSDTVGFMSYAPGDLDNIRVATLPAQMQPFAPPVLGTFRFISNQSHHVEESWLWLKFLAQNVQVEDLSLPTLRSRAEQPEAWSQSTVSPIDRIKLLSLVSQPAPILDFKKDFSNGSFGNMLTLIDEEVRFALSRKVRLEDKPIASRGNMKLVAEQWQGLLAGQVAKQTASPGEINGCSSMITINQPLDGEVITGSVKIEGIVDVDDLAYYELAYLSMDEGFKRFDGGFKAVPVMSQLGMFDTQGLPDGNYTLRLQVTSRSGKFSTPCTLHVTVNNKS